MIENLVYFYLLAPLHTGGTTQEGNLLGIARESHTNLPYIPSSTIRGRLRASVIDSIDDRHQLFGKDLDSGDTLTQGDIWIGDGSLLWLPIPSLSHGVIWVSSPLLLQRWARLTQQSITLPSEKYACFGMDAKKPVYLKDAIIKPSELTALSQDQFKALMPQSAHTATVKRAIVLPDQHCATLIQMGLWRQVKIKLDEYKTVKDGSFRYEEAIPPDTIMYFPWGTTTQAKHGTGSQSAADFTTLLNQADILQIGGQESLGRGFVQTWLAH